MKPSLPGALLLLWVTTLYAIDLNVDDKGTHPTAPHFHSAATIACH